MIWQLECTQNSTRRLKMSVGLEKKICTNLAKSFRAFTPYEDYFHRQLAFYGSEKVCCTVLSDSNEKESLLEKMISCKNDW